ncbi:MAG: sugar ABC transporter substrate-binding protein [Clostridium butyricum]|nr:sugar ABC transporter substrate-binding protein [Clostridium butyricum]
MKKIKKRKFIFLFLLLLLSFLLLLNEALNSPKEINTYDISIITRGKIDESLVILKEGAEQAAKEVNANIKFISLSENNNIQEQKELIEKESKSGADAILISPTDYNEISNSIEEASEKIPIILLESSIKTKHKINNVTFDNYESGKSLGKEILKSDYRNKKIAIVTNNLKCVAVEDRYNGLINILENENVNIIMEKFNDSEVDTYYNKAQDLLTKNKVDIVITFDIEILESIAQVKKDLINNGIISSNIKIYGWGSTNKIVSFLEEDIINGIVLQNEFNIGYLGIKNAINFINNNKNENNIIPSIIITKENMYSKENQRLLFLFVR